MTSWICPKCERKFRMANQWHDCVTNDIDSLFKGKNPELLIVFDKLLSNIIDWPDVSVGPTSNCIVFVKDKTFLIIRPMKELLDLKFYLKERHFDHHIHKSVEYGEKYEHHIRLSSVEDITPEVSKFIKMAYDF